MRPSRQWPGEWRRAMPQWADDEGSAALEFVTAGLILLLPLVYLILTMAAIQAGALAAEGAARQAARVFVQAPDAASATAAATRAVQFALADHGIDPASAKVAITCTPDPADCLAKGAYVSVSVDLAVPLPFAPSAIAGPFPVAVPLHSDAVQQVSRFLEAE